MTEALTLDKLVAMERKLRADLTRMPYSPMRAAQFFAGLRVVEDPQCLVQSRTPRFPVSRHRSRRIHKKLERRLGPQWPMIPASYRIGDMLVAHPAILAAARNA